MSFEKIVEDINQKRKTLSSSNSFDEIISTWQNIKSNHKECEKILNDISKQIISLENIEKDENLNLTISFSEAFNEMKILSEKIKNAPILELPELIKRLQILKNFCMNKIEQETIKIEEA